MQIDELLSRFGLLDGEGFLMPPQHPAVERLTQRMVDLMEVQQSGLKLSADTVLELKALQCVFDYYNSVLEDQLELEEDEESDD